MLLKQTDLRNSPIRRIVALGDSVTWGMAAQTKEKRWTNLAAAMLEEYQEEKIELINKGICGNILSPDSPARPYADGPCGLERLQEDVIACEPDMIFLAYGLNDARGGTPPEIFRKDYQKMIDEIRSRLSPVIVSLNLYYMHEAFYRECEGWNESDYDITEEFNLIIRQLCEKNSLIYADVYTAQSGVDWTVCEDHCHPNDLGHRLIANRVFEAVVRNCSLKGKRHNPPSHPSAL